MNPRKVKGLKVGIVCSRFNEFVVNALLDGARRNLAKHGVQEKNIEVFWVPGAYEIPVMARLMALSRKYDALVTLGAVIRGDTAHFDYVCQGVTDGVMQVSLSRSKPIGFGVLMCESVEQAKARAGFADSFEDKGFDSAVAALSILNK